MTDSLKIKEKVKERYGKIALIGGSCCAPSVGTREEESGGCCTGSNKTVLQPLQSQSPEQVAELVG
jgi:arsenite methyltransferase